MLEVLDEILRRCDAGEAVAVCTVVRTRGSTPQKSGAVMVVLQDGQTLGTIGGGCVEAEVRTQALQRLTNQNDALLTFKLDHDLGWDDGLVCGGTMDVAVEILDSPARAEALREVREVLAAGRKAAVRVIVPDTEGIQKTFDRTIDPVPTLVIAGAGHVGLALADVASRMGFRVTVIDDRADLVSPERFPHATRIVAEIEEELGRIPIGEETYIVIVTRGHRHDGRALGAVIRSNAKYIGLIGSRRKIVTILEGLAGQGVSREQLAAVHAPIGLNIGAVTPEEIAVSIAAELIAVRRGSTGEAAPMRLTPEQVDRIMPGIASDDRR